MIFFFTFSGQTAQGIHLPWGKVRIRFVMKRKNISFTL